jgi:hypothetical protein
MRELNRSEEVRRDDERKGELHPIRARRFVPTAELQAALQGVGRIDSKRFREDVDEILDQDSTPRCWREG